MYFDQFPVYITNPDLGNICIENIDLYTAFRIFIADQDIMISHIKLTGKYKNSEAYLKPYIKQIQGLSKSDRLHRIIQLLHEYTFEEITFTNLPDATPVYFRYYIGTVYFEHASSKTKRQKITDFMEFFCMPTDIVDVVFTLFDFKFPLFKFHGISNTEFAPIKEKILSFDGKGLWQHSFYRNGEFLEDFAYFPQKFHPSVLKEMKFWESHDTIIYYAQQTVRFNDYIFIIFLDENNELKHPIYREWLNLCPEINYLKQIEKFKQIEMIEESFEIFKSKNAINYHYLFIRESDKMIQNNGEFLFDQLKMANIVSYSCIFTYDDQRSPNLEHDAPTNYILQNTLNQLNLDPHLHLYVFKNSQSPGYLLKKLDFDNPNPFQYE